MNVFNVINKGNIISLDYEETKTINLNIPNYTRKVILCYVKPGFNP